MENDSLKNFAFAVKFLHDAGLVAPDAIENLFSIENLKKQIDRFDLMIDKQIPESVIKNMLKNVWVLCEQKEPEKDGLYLVSAETCGCDGCKRAFIGVAYWYQGQWLSNVMGTIYAWSFAPDPAMKV